jgi:dihydrofolate reductase
MGRKTWDSLPVRFRPLPGRMNVVITRQTDWSGAGAKVAASLADALALCEAAAQVWVIGGAQIFAEAEPLADRIEVTEIAQQFEGDTYAPAFGSCWVEAAREEHLSSTGLPFSFITYIRQNYQGD